MTRRIQTRIISFLLIFVMFMGILPGAALVSFASGSRENAENKKEILEASDHFIREAERKTGVIKDRSEIPSSAQAAVYIDGKLLKSGDFSSMWNFAMENAPNIDESYSAEQIEKMSEVEYVFNANMFYDKTWFGEKTMTVSGKKFTIDLNGHILKRTDNGGSVIKVNNYSVLTIMDSNPDVVNFSYARDEVINKIGFTVDNFKVKGGVIAGGYYSMGDGGGLYIDGYSTVRMLGGTISGNKADIGSAVYLDKGSMLDMRGGNAQICYNYSAGTTSDGGAIFLNSDCSVYGGNVHHNLADDYGGGVRAEGGNIVISDMIIHHNRALEVGGGIYIERSSIEQTVAVDNCIIVDNYANEEGGGIYIYDLFQAKLNNCIVQNNAAGDEGGGIFLSDWTGTDIHLSGEMIVRYNYVSSISEMYSDYKSNLYLEGDDDLIVGSLSVNSEIWIRLESNLDKYNGINNCITVEPTNVSCYFFRSDVDGYRIENQNIPTHENYRHLYFTKGTREAYPFTVLTDYAPALMSAPYTVGSGVYQGREFGLYRGYFQYTLSSTEEFMAVTPFYYSDGYFFEDPAVYNEHLATMSSNLSFAAFGVISDAVSGNAYANNFANIKQLFADIGCADENFYVNEDYQKEPVYYGEDDKLSTIAVAISQKEIAVDGKTYVLLPVAIRGRGYGAEWGSNVTLGLEGEAKGFADAANQVYSCLNDYISDYGLAEKAEQGLLKFWVVGYSRAGATANLASKRMIDDYAERGNQVYCYTFEAPQGGIESEKKQEGYTDNGQYLSIHNIVNENDIVPLVGPSQMGFIRYGVDHLIGSDHENGNGVSYDPNSAYYQQRMLMLEQLKAINPYYNFNDYWELADVNIILSNLPIWATDLIDKGVQLWDNPNSECKDMYSFNRWFLSMFIQDGLSLSDMDDAREAYSTKKYLETITGNKETDYPYSSEFYNFAYSDYTVEQSVSGVLQVLFGLSIEDQNKLMEILTENANFYMNNELSILGRYNLYSDAIKNWDEKNETERVEILNKILQNILNGEDDENSIWNEFDAEESEILAKSLPVLMWVLLNYASNDYNTGLADDGMWGVGTLVNNLEAIFSNHYQEVTHAWLRSYDSYYENDLKAYTISKTSAQAPMMDSDSQPGKIMLTAEKGSSIFYSVDGGESWLLYTDPIDASNLDSELEAFSVSYGFKSAITYILPYEKPLNLGSMIGEGSVIFVAAILLFATAGIVMTAVVKKKKKRSDSLEKSSENDE